MRRAIRRAARMLLGLPEQRKRFQAAWRGGRLNGAAAGLQANACNVHAQSPLCRIRRTSNTLWWMSWSGPTLTSLGRAAAVGAGIEADGGRGGRAQGAEGPPGAPCWRCSPWTTCC